MAPWVIDDRKIEHASPEGLEPVDHIRGIPVFNDGGLFAMIGERAYSVVECAICEGLEIYGDDVELHDVSVCCPCADAIMNLKHHKHSGEYITWPNDETEVDRREKRRKINASLRRAVHERDHYACRYCGARQKLEIDHVQPITKDGENDVDNLVTACHDCNQRKFNRTPDEAGMTLHPPEAFA